MNKQNLGSSVQYFDLVIHYYFWKIMFYYQCSQIISFTKILFTSYCAVVDCYNGAKKLKKWKDLNCKIHGALIKETVFIFATNLNFQVV